MIISATSPATSSRTLSGSAESRRVALSSHKKRQMGFLLTNLESGLVPLELISCFFWQNILRHCYLALYSCGFGITSKRLQLLVSSVCGNLRIVFGSGFAGLGFTKWERRVRPRFPSIWLIVKLQQAHDRSSANSGRTFT